MNILILMLFIGFAFTDSSKIILDRKQSKNAFRQDSSLDMSITRNESELIEFIEATMKIISYGSIKGTFMAKAFWICKY